MSDRVTGEYRLRLSFDRPEPGSYDDFRDIATANISDAFYKGQTLPHEIRPVYHGCPGFVGPAVTVLISPGDELLSLKAIDIAEPGDVIVVTGGYSPRFSVWGGVMCTMAKAKGVAGLVTDGLVRDVAQIRALAFPVYAAGVTPVGTSHDVPPGALNYPITIGIAHIRPGDLIVADEDGIVCVPQEQIGSVRSAVRVRVEKENTWLAQIDKSRGLIPPFRELVEKSLAARKTQLSEA